MCSCYSISWMTGRGSTFVFDISLRTARVQFTVCPPVPPPMHIDAMAAISASLFDFTIKARSKKNSRLENTIEYGHIYGELIPCGSRVPYRMSRYFPHTFNVSYTRVRYSILSLYVLLVEPFHECIIFR